MESYQVILLILLLAAFFYVAVLLYVLTNMREFSSRLKKRQRALMMLMNEKTDILIAICDFLVASKVEFSDEDKQIMEELRLLNFDKTGEVQVKRCAKVIHNAHVRLNYLIQNNNWLKKDLRIASFVETYEELDHNVRQSMAIYNADVAGYMYWFNIPSCKIAVWLLGYRKKETVN